MEQELSDVLIVLADKLGVATERVFDVFVGAQVLIGVIDIAVVIGAVAVGVYTAYKTFRWFRKRDEDEDGDWNDEDILGAVCIALGVGAVVCMVCGMALDIVGASVLHIVVPEYTAAKEIIGILKL